MAEMAVTQIMNGTAEALKEVMTNEHRSPFSIISQMNILDLCLQDTSLLVRRQYLYNVISMAKNEAIINWKRFTGKFISFQSLFCEFYEFYEFYDCLYIIYSGNSHLLPILLRGKSLLWYSSVGPGNSRDY